MSIDLNMNAKIYIFKLNNYIYNYMYTFICGASIDLLHENFKAL